MDIGLYQSIATEIGARIAAGELRPGDKIPSAQNLREQYGISHITAVRVYGELQEQALIEQRPGRGYFVRSGNNKKEAARHGMIASFVRPLRMHSSDNYFNEINFGLQSACLEHCFNLLSSHAIRPLNQTPVGPAVQRQLLAAMQEQAPKVDGMLLDERITDEVIEEVLRIPGIPPMVLLNRYSPLVDSVLPPCRENMAELARLTERFGYRKCLYLEAGTLQSIDCEYGAAFRKYFDGGPLEIVPNCCIDSAEQTEKRIAAALERLTALPGRLLVLGLSDTSVLQFGRLAAEQGMTPGVDFGLCGGQNTLQLDFAPLPVASMLPGTVEMGKLAVHALQERMRTPRLAPRILTSKGGIKMGKTL